MVNLSCDDSAHLHTVVNRNWLFFKPHVRFNQLSFKFRSLTLFLLSADFADFRTFLWNSVFQDLLVDRFRQNLTELGTEFWVGAENERIWIMDWAIGTGGERMHWRDAGRNLSFNWEKMVKGDLVWLSRWTRNSSRFIWWKVREEFDV